MNDELKVIKIDVTKQQLQEEFISRFLNYIVWKSVKSFNDKNIFKYEMFSTSWDSIDEENADWLIAIAYLVGKHTAIEWSYLILPYMSAKNIYSNKINESFIADIMIEILNKLDNSIENNITIEEITSVCYSTFFKIQLNLID